MGKQRIKFFDVMNSSSHLWWQRPKIHTDESEKEERKASWLELFYDLVFVAVIAQLSHTLSAHVTWKGLLEYIVLFIPVWWLWNGSTYYNERFEVNNVRHRLFTFLKMLPIAAMAYAIHDAFGKTAYIFIWAYVAYRIILIYMWLSAGKANDEVTYKVTKYYAIGFVISVVLWIVSLFIPMPFRLVFWGTGLLIEFITPLTTFRLQVRMPKVSTSHLPERFGLFTIVTIAEIIIGVINGASKIHHITLVNAIVAALGLFLAFSIWWVYFDHIMSRPYKRNLWSIITWGYLHLPLLFGITAIGAGIVNIVAYESEVLAAPLRWLLCGSVAFVLFIMALIGLTAETHLHGQVLTLHENINIQFLLSKIIAAVFVLGIGLLGASLNPLVLLLLLIAVMGSQVVHSLYLWVYAQMAQSQ